MSPRITIKMECPYAECEEYTSTRRGTVVRTVICHHPENEGCLCVLDPSVGGRCVWYAEAKASQEVKVQKEKK
jgi:hypothetical protein